MDKIHFANEEIEREEGASTEDEYPHNVLVTNIRRTLKSLGPPLSPKCCIYMVPNKLRRVNEAAYTPQAVSIGPLHYGKKALNNMQKHKLQYLDKFLERAVRSASLEDFVSTIKEWESSIRCCYAEAFDHLCSDEFVKMILVDAGFIFELFLREYNQSLKDLNDSILYKPWLQIDIQQDLILLENQLPFFVLEGLYDLAIAFRPNNYPSFLELTCCYFSQYNNQNNSIQHEVKHFTDILRSFQLPTLQTHDGSYYFPDCDKQNDNIDHLYSATKLHEAGVKFEVSSSQCLLDIKFSNGVLKIPYLKLYDTTESFIRNLMALEQCHHPLETYICDYVSVMDYLIKTDKDVDLLVGKKIIVNWLGSQGAVVTLFNKLCTHIVEVKGSYYTRLCKDMNAYYEVPSHRWKAMLRHEYFSTPWIGTSTIAAFIFLVLTLTQTICNIMSL